MIVCLIAAATGCSNAISRADRESQKFMHIAFKCFINEDAPVLGQFLLDVFLYLNEVSLRFANCSFHRVAIS